MSKKTHLKGDIDSPSGHAPLAAWQSVEAQVRRPEDLWLSGDPRSLLSDRHDHWKARIHERLSFPNGPMGLRMRFVVAHQPGDELDLIGLTGAALRALPQSWEGLFLHSELMSGPEPGLYLAFENRPPALLTQVHFGKGEAPAGEFVPASGPLHINILLHDPALGFRQAWESTLLENLLEQASTMVEPTFARGQIHELSMARSDLHSSGVSVGLEQVWEEQGSIGGFSAGDRGSRNRLGENAPPSHEPCSCSFGFDRVPPGGPRTTPRGLAGALSGWPSSQPAGELVTFFR
jgi:hypothetical protein